MLLSCLFLYLNSFKFVKLKVLLSLVISALVLLYLFGIMGNVRSSISREDESMILNITQATESFKTNNIPNEYYWAYLYLGSPIGNLQSVVNKAHKNKEIDIKSFNNFIKTSILFDFIGKRLGSFVEKDTESISDYFVFEIINASTVYSHSFKFLGWLGPILMFLFMMINIFMYIIIRKSVYFYSGFSILLALISFQVFNNLWPYSALSLELLFPVVLSGLHSLKNKT